MDKQLSTRGVTMHYTVTGNGPDTVILMHGWGCDASTVESMRAVLAPCHRVLTVDFPGHGSSTEPPLRPDGTPWGVDDYTRVIEDLVAAEDAGEPILVGHSFGGRVAILYASRNNVKKMVLVDAAGVKPRRQLGYYLKVYRFKIYKKLAPMLLGKKRGETLIERYRSRRGSADYRQASPMMRSVMSKVVNEDLRHVMPLVKAPTLLMWGEEDTATPMSDARIMEKLIPDAGLVSFSHCGHFSFLDNPAAFSRVLDNFLNQSR
ncbi:MAG: alpha/beta hydrolase [Clostridiales bacterium]|nr:alpha/beta hydrolase [Clostridiales bacterium]